jgi:hypothetical protein
MKNPITTLANDSHRDTPVVSKGFEENHKFTGKKALGRKSSKTEEISTHARLLL